MFMTSTLNHLLICWQNTFFLIKRYVNFLDRNANTIVKRNMSGREKDSNALQCFVCI